MTAADTVRRPRTPVHLWIVGALAVLWNSMGVVDYLMTQTRNEAYLSRFTPEQLDYFYSFPTWTISFWALAVWGAFLGSVLLLLRIRWAGLAFFVALLAVIPTTIHNYVLSNGYEMMDGAAGATFAAVIYLATIGLLLYSRAMCERGVLR
jgi:hypothetical protein